MTNTRQILGLAIVVVAMVLGMNSCSLYGKYQPQNTDADSIPVPAWREVFTDPYLQTYIEYALANNLDLKIAHEHVTQAEAMLLGAKLAYLPTIQAGGSPAVSYSGGGTNAIKYGFGAASWEIDIFGRLTNQKRMANASRLEMMDWEQAARTELIAAVASTYYQILMLQASIVTCDSAVMNWEKSVMTMREMKAAGMYDEAAVSQFEGSWYSTRATAKSLRLDLVQAMNAMDLLLCHDGESGFNFAGLDDVLLDANVISSINLRALRARPDVKAAEHQLEYAFYNRNYARSNCCPSISIGGTIGWGGGGLIFNAVGNLLQPLFNSGRNIAQVRVSKSQLLEMQMNYANALLKAGTEVNNALASRQTANDQVADYRGQVMALTRALDATTTKMSLGRGTYLEVLTAQNDLLKAQFAEIENKANILMSNVTLYQALGGGK